MPVIRKRSSSSVRAVAVRKSAAKKKVSAKRKLSIAKRRIIRLKSRIVKSVTKKRVSTIKGPAVKKRAAAKKRPMAKKRAVVKKRPMAKKRVVAKKKPVVKENFMSSKTLVPMVMVFVKFKKDTPLKVLQTPFKHKNLHEAWSWAGEWDCGYLFDVRRYSELRETLNKTLKKSKWIAKIKTKWIEKCW